MVSKKYVYANQKGGITKTTTAMSAAIMARLCGKRVLLVDMDPQANTTSGVGYNPDELAHTVYTVMQGQSGISQTLKQTHIDKGSGSFFDPTNERVMQELGITSTTEAVRGPDLLPNNILAASADTELQEFPTWGMLLRDLLAKVEDHYDEIHIDTNPSLGRLTVNALYCSTHVVIPMTPEVFSLQGMVALARSIDRARRGNPALSVAGIVFTRVRYRTHQQIMARIREQLVQELNKQYQELNMCCFESVINEGAAFSEAATRRSSVIITDPTSFHALQCWGFYVELLLRTGGTGQESARKNYEQIYRLFQATKVEDRTRKGQPAGLTEKKRGEE